MKYHEKLKYRVKLKTTVTTWVEVTVPAEHVDNQEAREWAADDAVTYPDEFRDRLAAAGLEHGPIELAYEQLDESVEVVA